MKIYGSIDELIGKTPLIRMSKLEEHYSVGAEIVAKLEAKNPAGSIKDRAAKFMLDAAEKDGILTKDSVIIEPTSGNTGIGLAALGAMRGYRVIIVMPNTMSRERIAIMEAYGAEVVLTDGALGMKGAIAKASELAAALPHSFIPSQFENLNNKAAHIATTAPEIYEDTDGELYAVVAGVGTGGTVSGIGEYMKAKNPNIKIIAVEPSDSPFISEGRAGAHKLQGIGAGFLPEILNMAVIDEVITISTEEAYEAARVAAASDGILVGISSGAALAAAAKLGAREEYRGKRIVVILPDSGDRYLTTELFMKE